ncbi:MAG: ammonium transporter [Pirellulaceae bacterium]
MRNSGCCKLVTAIGLLAFASLLNPVRVFATQETTEASAETVADASTAEVQEPAADGPRIVETTDDVADPDSALSQAKNAWMLTCCALVLFMTAPGLALFYGGLVRKKNVLSVMMQCIFLMGMMTVLWAIIGYSLAFGGDNAYWGNLEYLFMNNVSRYWDANLGASVTPMNGDIPELTVMLFQGMFFIITPALICGAFAERMKFSAMVLFSAIWGLLVYCPICHWVWDGGILAHGAGWAGGALDFAGGTVVHISSGISALLIAIMIGQRAGHGSQPMPPHNLTYTAMGAAMLWIGWFGFNAGSGLAPDGLGSSAFAVTHFSASAGAVAWATMEWIRSGKPTVLGACSGAVAGLVCITPAAGFVNTMPSLLMGAAAGVVCYFGCTTLKNKMAYDDSLDAFGVHGIGGIVGAVLTGVFATRAVNDVNEGAAVGLIDGNASLIIGQLVAVLVTIVYALVVSLVILNVVEAILGGLRVSKDEETQGLDVTQHGEEGYIFF